MTHVTTLLLSLNFVSQSSSISNTIALEVRYLIPVLNLRQGLTV